MSQSNLLLFQFQ